MERERKHTLYSQSQYDTNMYGLVGLAGVDVRPGKIRRSSQLQMEMKIDIEHLRLYTQIKV